MKKLFQQLFCKHDFISIPIRVDMYDKSDNIIYPVELYQCKLCGKFKLKTTKI